MCSPQPDQVTFPQDEQVTGEHIGASWKLNIYLILANALGGIKKKWKSRLLWLVSQRLGFAVVH